MNEPINFFMMPNGVFNLMLKPNELSVLCYLQMRADSNGNSFPAIGTIASDCRISKNTVRKALDSLCKRKIIQKDLCYIKGKENQYATQTYNFKINGDFFENSFSHKNLADSILQGFLVP